MEVNKIHTGKWPEPSKSFPANFFDSCVTDPPYGISFMNKHWDYDIPGIDEWKEVYRVLKPGAHMLVACGTRTQHRMVVNIEDAGFEIRDVITWHYGSGFPKSMDISKAIDKAAGAEREVTGKYVPPNGKEWNLKQADNPQINHAEPTFTSSGVRTLDITSPATDDAKKWDGWGTALKPATEFWTLCRKPLEGTVAENIKKYGTGGLNINECRVGFQDEKDKEGATWGRGTNIMGGNYVGATHGDGRENIEANPRGRFPANLILDEFTANLLDEQAPKAGAFAPVKRGMPGESKGVYGDFAEKGDDGESFYGDVGGASRFFYCAKADRQERDKGLSGFETQAFTQSNGGKAALDRGDSEVPNNGSSVGMNKIKMVKNYHPTVKPVDLMRYLVKLVTPKGGVCLDPYCGSGTTLIGCKMELINYVGVEMVPGHVEIAEARVKAWNPDKYIPQTLF